MFAWNLPPSEPPESPEWVRWKNKYLVYHAANGFVFSRYNGWCAYKKEPRMCPHAFFLFCSSEFFFLGSRGALREALGLKQVHMSFLSCTLDTEYCTLDTIKSEI